MLKYISKKIFKKYNNDIIFYVIIMSRTTFWKNIIENFKILKSLQGNFHLFLFHSPIINFLFVFLFIVSGEYYL